MLFYGAGQAGIGIGNTIVAAMQDQGIPREQACGNCWYFDSRGLLVSDRDDIPLQKQPYAHDHAASTTSPRRWCLTQTGQRSQEALAGRGWGVYRGGEKAMAELNERPIISSPCPIPPPTPECSAEQAYSWSDGRAIFASGSPSGRLFGQQDPGPGRGQQRLHLPLGSGWAPLPAVPPG